MVLKDRIEKALAYIQAKTQITPAVGLILGSGLGDFADDLEYPLIIPYGEIPGFPISTVDGHQGAFVFGQHNGKQIVALQGRLHYYEGYTQQEITMPIRIMRKLGVNALIITNAAGAVNPLFSVGTLMVVSDHINYSGNNPLIGINLDEFGPRFPDMSNIYTPSLRSKLKLVAQEKEIPLNEGVYAMFSGPSYETPAEVRFAQVMGADVVGMSTVPEAIVASHCGMDVLGVSCITNMAAGMLNQKLNHEEVVTTANLAKSDFTKLVSLAIDIL